MFKPRFFVFQPSRGRAPRPLWHWVGVLGLTGVASGLLWLDSLDRYALARLNVSLAEHLSPAWFEPSRRLSLLLQPNAQHSQLPADVPSPAASPAAASVKAPHTFDPVDVPLPAQGYWPDVQQQKMPTAVQQRVVFVGDSMMQGVAPWVIRALGKSQPDWQMRDLSRQSTGLSARRYFDWPARIAQEMQNPGLTALVVFLGPNDPQDLLDDAGHRHVFPKPSWQVTYAQRVDEILRQAKQRGVYVLWVGLPAMREARLQRGAQVLNRIFYARAKAFGTDYLSLEPLLGLVNAPYRHTVQTANAGVQVVRASDGTHFTPAGQQRIEAAVLARLLQAAAP